jgi:hypothetical protein
MPDQPTHREVAEQQSGHGTYSLAFERIWELIAAIYPEGRTEVPRAWASAVARERYLRGHLGDLEVRGHLGHMELRRHLAPDLELPGLAPDLELPGLAPELKILTAPERKVLTALVRTRAVPPEELARVRHLLATLAPELEVRAVRARARDPFVELARARGARAELARERELVLGELARAREARAELARERELVLGELARAREARAERAWVRTAEEYPWLLGMPDASDPRHDGYAVGNIPVSIYLADEDIHEQVETAVEQWLATADVSIDTRAEPVIGSWFRRMGASMKKTVGTPAAREAALTGMHIVDSRLVQAQDAHVTSTLFQNLGPVLAALQPTKDAVVRAGALLIVKIDWVVQVHQLTAAQQAILDHRPQLATTPKEIIAALQFPDPSGGEAAIQSAVQGIGSGENATTTAD